MAHRANAQCDPQKGHTAPNHLGLLFFRPDSGLYVGVEPQVKIAAVSMG